MRARADGNDAGGAMEVLAIGGTIDVNNHRPRAVETDHRDDLALAEGILAFRFTAGAPDRSDVFVSEDAAGAGNGA